MEMIKFVSLLKRRKGMSFEDFMEYYEKKHVPLGRDHVSDALHYQRRFLRPVDHPILGIAPNAYDCILEIWFEDQATMEASFKRFDTPGVKQAILEDESNLFEPNTTQCFVVESECTTKSILCDEMFIHSECE